MEKDIGAVVVAAGYGMITPGVTKLVEEIGGVPMIALVLDAVAASGIAPVIVVVNRRFGAQIAEALAAAGLRAEVIFAEQEERQGAADAVRCAVPALRAAGCATAVSVFGDMPCWRPETLRAFAASHRQAGARFSMALIPVDAVAGHPEFDQFGRALVGPDGRVVGTFEPRDRKPSAEELARAAFLNPALYAMDLDFFEEFFPRIPPYPRSDGYPDELHLPALVKVASDAGVAIGTFILRDFEQARGVNTAKELALLQDVLARRETLAPTAAAVTATAAG